MYCTDFERVECVLFPDRYLIGCFCILPKGLGDGSWVVLILKAVMLVYYGNKHYLPIFLVVHRTTAVFIFGSPTKFLVVLGLPDYHYFDPCYKGTHFNVYATALLDD